MRLSDSAGYLTSAGTIPDRMSDGLFRAAFLRLLLRRGCCRSPISVSMSGLGVSNPFIPLQSIFSYTSIQPPCLFSSWVEFHIETGSRGKFTEGLLVGTKAD